MNKKRLFKSIKSKGTIQILAITGLILLLFGGLVYYGLNTIKSDIEVGLKDVEKSVEDKLVKSIDQSSVALSTEFINTATTDLEFSMNKIVEIIEMQFSELDLIVKLITDNPGVKKAYTGEDDLA